MSVNTKTDIHLHFGDGLDESAPTAKHLSGVGWDMIVIEARHQGPANIIVHHHAGWQEVSQEVMDERILRFVDQLTAALEPIRRDAMQRITARLAVPTAAGQPR